MCDPATIAAIGSLFSGAGAATAAGAAAGAATLGSTLQTVGTLVSIGGSLAQGAAAGRAGRENSALLEQQARNEAALSGIEDLRTRERFRAELHRQTAELAARGVSLDSPTAVMLAQNAGQELSFASQEVRSRGVARVAELSSAAKAARARGRLGVLKGTLSAASTFLSAAPDIWPGLKDQGASGAQPVLS